MRLLLLFFAMLLVSEASAQQIVAQLDLDRRQPKPDFYEYSPVDKGLLTFGPSSTTSSRFLGLVKYDANLQQRWTRQVVEQNGRNNVDLMTVCGPYTYVFVSESFPKEKVIKTYYYKYDLEGKPLAEGEPMAVYPISEESGKEELKYIHSPNKRRLMCYRVIEGGKEAEKILYYIFDDEGNYLANGELAMKYPDNLFKIRAVKVSNLGNIYVLGKMYEVAHVREADDYKFVLYKYLTAQERGGEVRLPNHNAYITDITFALDRDENVYIGGFYSRQSAENLAGTLYMKISSEGAIVKDTTVAFGTKFLNNYLSNNQISRGRELKSFFLNDVILRSDGGMMMLAEKFYTTRQSYRDVYGMWIDQVIYHYDDVILSSLDGNGAIEWQGIVDKTQSGVTRQTLSFFNAAGAENIFLFYEYIDRAGLNIYYHTVDANGTVSNRLPLLREYRPGNVFYPSSSIQINNREALLVFFQNRGRTLSVAKVALGGQ